MTGNGSNNSPNDLTSDPGCCVKFSDSISTPIQRRNSLSNLSGTTMGSLIIRQGWKKHFHSIMANKRLHLTVSDNR